MTDGHQHRTIRLPEHSIRLHLLRAPLRRSTDRERVERSRFTWRADDVAEIRTLSGRVVRTWPSSPAYELTPLGILHGLFGLTVDTRSEPIRRLSDGALRARRGPRG